MKCQKNHGRGLPSGRGFTGLIIVSRYPARGRQRSCTSNRCRQIIRGEVYKPSLRSSTSSPSGRHIHASRRDRRLRVGAPRRSRFAPAASVAPRPQPLRRNPQLPSNLAQRPAAAYQKLQSLLLKFIRILTTCRTHKTPSCSKRSSAKVSTVSEEVRSLRIPHVVIIGGANVEIAATVHRGSGSPLSLRTSKRLVATWGKPQALEG